MIYIKEDFIEILKCSADYLNGEMFNGDYWTTIKTQDGQSFDINVTGDVFHGDEGKYHVTLHPLHGDGVDYHSDWVRLDNIEPINRPIIQPRAWQIEHSEMCEVTVIDYNGERLGFGRQLEQEHFNEPDYWLPMSECVLLRPTGLNDKEGKPIYEGDIIRTHTDMVLKNYIRPVVWNQREGKFNIVDWGLQFCEVIGNVFETPELLKDYKL